MPTAILFRDGKTEFTFDEDYEEVRDRLVANHDEPIELHTDGAPTLVYPQSMVRVRAKKERRVGQIKVQT